jgi:glucuronate isomerase
MSQQLVDRLFHELEAIPLIDPHTHINPHAAASKSLADIMGYHYYTELAHSAGMPRERIEETGLDPKEKVHRLVEWLGPLENTVQFSWLMEICGAFFDFHEERITADNWEALYDHAAKRMVAPDWELQVLSTSRLEQVFLTNDFDDPLADFDSSRYVPCLRTDDLVFHLAKPAVRQRLAKATGCEAGTAAELVKAIGKLFEHFVKRGARACAISLPPDFEPSPVERQAVDPILKSLHHKHEPSADELATVSKFVFWTLTEQCAERRLPFDLMIGVNRRVYEEGVYERR